MPPRAVLSLLTIAIFSASAGADVTFDFETISEGTTTPFSVTASGVTATLSSLNGGLFSVADSAGLFTILAGNVVWDPGFEFYPLDIVFSEPMATITISFALGEREANQQSEWG